MGRRLCPELSVTLKAALLRMTSAFCPEEGGSNSQCSMHGQAQDFLLCTLPIHLAISFSFIYCTFPLFYLFSSCGERLFWISIRAWQFDGAIKPFFPFSLSSLPVIVCFSNWILEQVRQWIEGSGRLGSRLSRNGLICRAET